MAIRIVCEPAANDAYPPSGDEFEVIGARAFTNLLAHIREISDNTVTSLGDDADGRDYREMVRAIEECLARNVAQAGGGHRQGFLRVLADVLCAAADESAPAVDFDPLRTTRLAFTAVS